MKFDIRKRRTGKVQFTAEIECGADLAGADLYGAKLYGADLYDAAVEDV